MKKRTKKILLISLAVTLVIVFALGLSMNLILSNILDRTIKSELKKLNESGELDIRVKKVRVNVFSRSLIFKGITAVPDSSFLEDFKNGNSLKPTLPKVSISSLRLKGIDVYDFVINREVHLNRIVVDDVDLTLFKTSRYQKLLKKEVTNNTFAIDSIMIKGLKEVGLSKIEIDSYKFRMIDVITQDTFNSYKGSEFEVRGISLDAYLGSSGYFKFNTEKLRIKLRRQRFEIKGDKYYLYFNKFDFSFSDSLIVISEFVFKPKKDRFKIAASQKFNTVVFDAEAKEVRIHGLKIGEMLRSGIVDIDSVVVDRLKIELYKDKNKPFDLKKRPLFPQQGLKKLKLPLHIDKVIVKNSSLNYTDKPENKEKLMVVDLTEMNAEISFITSIKDSLKSGKYLSVNFKAKLMDASALRVDLIMPYNSKVDTFYYSGSLGRAQFVKFNPAIYPATGIKFDNGTLNSLEFAVQASPKRAEGSMTMLYDDLEAEITKKEVEKKDKTLSWLVNAVLPKSNPNKNGNVKVVVVEADRVSHKGMINLIWKSVQSGLVNTILPTGKKVKEDKKDDSGKDKKNKKDKKKWWQRKKKK